jgi:hypothetical protein
MINLQNIDIQGRTLHAKFIDVYVLFDEIIALNMAQVR